MKDRSLPAKPSSVEHIIDIHHWTPTLLSFTVTRPLPLTYLPGQYARLGVQVGDQLIWRAFSFVSAPHEDYLEFLAVLVPDGLFTARLREMQPGDTMHIEHENYGFLTADRFTDAEDCWMFATGTGIGPFISMLRDPQIWPRFRQLLLVHGVRDAGELVYRNELLALQANAQAHDGARLLLASCISRSSGKADSSAEGAALPQLAGRMTEAWDSGRLETATARMITPERSRVMLCGNPQMIDDMRARLHQRGLVPCRKLAPGQFLTENYW